MNLDEMEEELASVEHARWSHWQAYLHSCCTKNEDGSLTIPHDSVEHWQRQIDTPYSELTEKEKESDRKEVRKYLPLIRAALQTVADEAHGHGYDEGSQEQAERIRFLKNDNVLLEEELDIMKARAADGE